MQKYKRATTSMKKLLIDGKIIEATEEEIISNKIIEKIAYKYAHRWNQKYEFDDLVQIAMLGIIKAYRTIEDERREFTCYVDVIVKREILLHNRNSCRKKRNTENVISLNYSPCQKGTIEEITADSKNMEEEIINKLLIEKVINSIEENLKEKEKIVYREYFLKGRDIYDISTRLGCSHQYVYRLKNQINNKIKKIAEEY